MHKLRLFTVVVVVVVMVVSAGCESFRKKFIRKKKHEPAEEEMVITPRDYSKEQLPSDQAYRRYFTYWKAWHMELVAHLHEDASRKKILSCFEQALLNLTRMKKLLANEEKSKKLQGYIENVASLQAEMQEKNSQMVSFSRFRQALELLLRDIQRGFAFSKVKDDLQW